MNELSWRASNSSAAPSPSPIPSDVVSPGPLGTQVEIDDVGWIPSWVYNTDERYPEPLLAFLRLNREGSARFVEDRPLRDAWFSTHDFRPEGILCIDGRVQDAPKVLGLKPGVAEIFRAGGSKCDLGNLLYALRTYQGVERLSPARCNGNGKPDARSCAERVSRFDLAPCEESYRAKIAMRIVTAHYSYSHPTTDSCKAWEHQTGAALRAMRRHANELNQAYRGRMVAFTALIDTDLDAFDFFGPGDGCLSVRELATDGRASIGLGEVMDLLHRVFPSSWEPLVALEESYRNRFHLELAERVLANIDSVRQAFGRAPELLSHNEELVFVGRHADWNEEHNSVFLIDDTEDRDTVLNYFTIALRYVSRNVILRAIREGNDDWVVPIVVNIPYTSEGDEMATLIYTRKLYQRLKAHAEAIVRDVVSSILDGSHGIPSEQIPDRVFRQIHGLVDRFSFMTSISLRADRLFRPFV